MEALLKQQTILIVDDAKSNINVLAELLRSDYIIKAATSGEKALTIALSENPPDLILLDVVMPEMDGYEVCKRLKASSQTKNIPIIFITGKLGEEDEINGFNLGAMDYITKPFSPVVVKARVNTHLELKRHRDYLEGISYLDGLTGIPNRRKFNSYLGLSWNDAIQESMPVSMILIDIDNFKLFNDNYGHLEGDNCLTQIAQALSKTLVRKNDFVARYGGEEFVCVLPNTNLEGALLIAEKLRLSVVNLQIPHIYSYTENIVTVSLGVATVIPDANSSCSLLIKSADDALYKSKESGKNKVCTLI
ncbi:MAG TPA: diguanylate cyclase response regulator [Clostridiales bacterium]|nr:MAG: diguanylate cyclase response regulator [Candidatus Margulisbacteria bacterium GWF2_35_9]HAN21176.1 diguanylate cyclase response regulator [Clostridiales bacterium]